MQAAPANSIHQVVYTTKEYPKEGINDGATPFVTNGIVVVQLKINPIDGEAANAITSVALAYRVDFGDIAFVNMEKGSVDAEKGQLWAATIPGSVITQAGHILRWAAIITDAVGNRWRSPSFCAPDNTYELSNLRNRAVADRPPLPRPKPLPPLRRLLKTAS